MSVNPFFDLEELLSGEVLETLKNDFIAECIDEYGSSIETVINEYGKITYYGSYFDSQLGKSVEGYVEISFESKLKSILSAEFRKSKILLDKQLLSRGGDYVDFLRFQEKNLQYLIDVGQKYIVLFPIILSFILNVKDYINDKYLSDKDFKIELTSSIDVKVELTDPDGDNAIIEAVLGYLRGYNDKKQKIMADDHFKLIIDCVSHYVKDGILPNNLPKIPELNLSKDLLRFTFWVLHKHLFTTRPIKDDFLKLIKNMFNDFDSWEISTLKSNFGNKSKVTIQGKKFVPEIIKREIPNRQ